MQIDITRFVRNPSGKSRLMVYLFKSLLAGSGLVILGWAGVTLRFRDSEGFLTGAFCWPIAMGIALFAVGWAVGGPLQKFACWFALGIVGQAGSLQLIDAGPALHYQHYKMFDRLISETPPFILLMLVVQTTLVIAAIRSHWPAIRTWIGHTFRLWQVISIGLVFFLPVAAVSPQVKVFIAEGALAAFLQTINLANLLLMVWALPAESLAALQQRYQRWFGQTTQDMNGEAGQIDSFVLIPVLWVTVLPALLAVISYERHPHITDEVAYLLQAHFFAAGALTLPAPPVPPAFGFYLMEFQGTDWYAATPPGWPALLAVGVLLGAPWLINPLLAGLNVLLVYLLLQEIYNRQLARLTVILLCSSPWQLFMSMNFMTHTFTLTCALAAALLVAWARRTDKARWAGLGGAMIGLGSIIRPLDGLIVAILMGLWTIGIGGKRLKNFSIISLGLGVILLGAAVLPYNQALTGSPTVFPLNAYIDKHFGAGRNDYGFGANRGFGWPLDPNPGHSPIDALINANLNSFSLNIELFGWSTGSLLLIALVVFTRRWRGSDALMISTIAAVFVAYFFYYYSGGPDFGARYWHLMLIPCVVLTARGMQLLQQQLSQRATVAALGSAHATAAVGLLCLLTLVNYIPWRAIDKYHHFWGMRPDIRELAQTYDFGTSLVLIRGLSHPDYTSAAIYNPLDLKAEAPIYAWDRDTEVRMQLLQHYADRPVWIVDGPTVTHSGYKVVAGPLTSQALLAAN